MWSARENWCQPISGGRRGKGWVRASWLARAIPAALLAIHVLWEMLCWFVSLFFCFLFLSLFFFFFCYSFYFFIFFVFSSLSFSFSSGKYMFVCFFLCSISISFSFYSVSFFFILFTFSSSLLFFLIFLLFLLLYNLFLYLHLLFSFFIFFFLFFFLFIHSFLCNFSLLFPTPFHRRLPCLRAIFRWQKNCRFHYDDIIRSNNMGVIMNTIMSLMQYHVHKVYGDGEVLCSYRPYERSQNSTSKKRVYFRSSRKKEKEKCFHLWCNYECAMTACICVWVRMITCMHSGV